MDSKHTYLFHPAMRLLHRGMQRERSAKLIFALCLICSGVVVPYLYFSKNIYAALLGISALIAGAAILFNVLHAPQKSGERLWSILNDSPRYIVWVYSVRTRLMPFGLHLWDTGTMYFKLADGDEISVALPAHQLKMVSKFLNRLLPHATFGYSEERREHFESDPKSLLR